MRDYWPDLEVQRGLDSWKDDASRDLIRRLRETGNVSRLEDVKILYHEHIDGIIPPTLVTDEW